MSEPMLTPQQIAGELRVSIDVVRVLVNDMPHLRTGSIRRVRREDFEQWKADGGRRAWVTQLARLAIPSERHFAAGGPVVYFVGQGELFVKIGTTANLAMRLDALRTASPVDLAVLAVLPGGRSFEMRLHKRFAGVRHRGEWFRRAGDLRRFIERVTTK